MKVLAKGTIEKTAENKQWFERKGYHLTGETLTIGTEYENTTYVVYTGRHTVYGTIRDCGDHYIRACYDRYDRIDKETLTITKDVEDR